MNVDELGEWMSEWVLRTGIEMTAMQRPVGALPKLNNSILDHDKTFVCRKVGGHRLKLARFRSLIPREGKISRPIRYQGLLD